MSWVEFLAQRDFRQEIFLQKTFWLFPVRLKAKRLCEFQAARVGENFPRDFLRLGGKRQSFLSVRKFRAELQTALFASGAYRKFPRVVAVRRGPFD